MFLKAIGIKALVVTILMSSLLLSGERFDVYNMGKIKDQSMSSSEDNAVFICLKSNPGELVAWLHAHDNVKSWKTDERRENILHLEFNNSQKLSVDMTEALQKFYTNRANSFALLNRRTLP